MISVRCERTESRVTALQALPLTVILVGSRLGAGRWPFPRARLGGREGGPAVQFGDVHVQDRADVELLAQRVAALIQTLSFTSIAGFGG